MAFSFCSTAALSSPREFRQSRLVPVCGPRLHHRPGRRRFLRRPGPPGVGQLDLLLGVGPLGQVALGQYGQLGAVALCQQRQPLLPILLDEAIPLPRGRVGCAVAGIGSQRVQGLLDRGELAFQPLQLVTARGKIMIELQILEPSPHHGGRLD